jgi:hypothetical protein
MKDYPVPGGDFTNQELLHSLLQREIAGHLVGQGNEVCASKQIISTQFWPVYFGGKMEPTTYDSMLSNMCAITAWPAYQVNVRNSANARTDEAVRILSRWHCCSVEYFFPRVNNRGHEVLSRHHSIVFDCDPSYPHNQLKKWWAQIRMPPGFVGAEPVKKFPVLKVSVSQRDSVPLQLHLDNNILSYTSRNAGSAAAQRRSTHRCTTSISFNPPCRTTGA